MFLGIIFFWTANVGSFDVLPDFVGYILLILGMTTACKYCKNFIKPRIAAYVGAVISLGMLTLQVFSLLDAEISDTLMSVATVTNTVFKMATVLITLVGVFGIAKETGARKTLKKSIISFLTVPVLCVAYLVLWIIPNVSEMTDEIKNKLLIFALICEIVYVAISFINVFSAYMWICVEGDENMEKKNHIPSPMDFFDRRRAKEAAEDEENRKREEAAKAGKSVAEMYGVQKKKKKGKK